MKRLFYTVFILSFLLLLGSCSKNADVTGHWAAQRYTILVDSNQEELRWVEQTAEFTSNFSIDFMEKNAMRVSAFGNSNGGTYSVSNDTVFVSVKETQSKYVLKEGDLYLVEHPKARIKYIRGE